MAFEGDGYVNIARASVPQVAFTQLGTLGMPGGGGDIQVGAAGTMTLVNDFGVDAIAYVWILGADTSLTCFSLAAGRSALVQMYLERSLNGGAYAIPAPMRGWNTGLVLTSFTTGPAAPAPDMNVSGAMFIEPVAVPAGTTLTYAVRRHFTLGSIVGGFSTFDVFVDAAQTDIFCIMVPG